jgi:hypothetical protein
MQRGVGSMYYERVFRTLQEQKIRYAVAGGVALVLHGVVRFTAGLDLIVDLEHENLVRFVRAMQDLGYRPRNPVKAEDFLDPQNRASWKRDKGMVVFSFTTPASSMELVDIFIEEIFTFPEIQKELFMVTAKGISIPVLSRNHLKQLKKAANRPQDQADIEALEAMERSDDMS